MSVCKIFLCSDSVSTISCLTAYDVLGAGNDIHSSIRAWAGIVARDQRPCDFSVLAHRRLSVFIRHQRMAVINADRQSLRWRSSPAERDRRLVIACQRRRNRFGYFRIGLAVRHANRVQRLASGSDKSMLLLFPACASSACRNASGNARPRFAARRRIPEQASRLKKYRGGILPLSKISDNEHTPSSLRNGTRVSVHSDVLSVQHSPCARIPDFINFSEESLEILPPVGAKDTRHIFPDEPSWMHSSKNPAIGEAEGASGIAEAALLSRDAESLTGSSSNQKVNCSTIFFSIDFRHVPQVLHSGETLFQDFTGTRFNLTEPDRFPAERHPRKGGRLDSGADAGVPHFTAFFWGVSGMINAIIFPLLSTIGVRNPFTANSASSSKTDAVRRNRELRAINSKSTISPLISS